MIEQYFKSLLDLIASLPFVENPTIHLEKRAEMVGFIRGNIVFKDSSLLHFRELVDLRLPMRIVMYAYHYQQRDGALIFRYDNTAHHMRVNTFPYHKHSEGEILPSTAVNLETVFREIEILVNKTVSD